VKKAEEAIEDAKKAINEGGVARLRQRRKRRAVAAQDRRRAVQDVASCRRRASRCGGGRQCRREFFGGAQEKKPGDVIDAEYVTWTSRSGQTEKVVSFK